MIHCRMKMNKGHVRLQQNKTCELQTWLNPAILCQFVILSWRTVFGFLNLKTPQSSWNTQPLQGTRRSLPVGPTRSYSASKVGSETMK
ncbi:hypothetical protein OS493_026228 [Desmophyllum pertusum]|uniref:Uncharacterized protein n=1 Tax=Desmophyllum pertusum TaxID=174260 RepID=A0A9X0D2W1_9CNID|nr:hypothetical protein OS493_026228 [Desmophyllum pertusum]